MSRLPENPTISGSSTAMSRIHWLSSTQWLASTTTTPVTPSGPVMPL